MLFFSVLVTAMLAGSAVAEPNVELQTRELVARAQPAGVSYTWWVGGTKNCETEPKAYAGFLPVGDCIYQYPGLTRKFWGSNYCVDFYNSQDCSGFPAQRVGRNLDKCINDPETKILSFKLTTDC